MEFLKTNSCFENTAPAMPRSQQSLTYSGQEHQNPHRSVAAHGNENTNYHHHGVSREDGHPGHGHLGHGHVHSHSHPQNHAYNTNIGIYGHNSHSQGLQGGNSSREYSYTQNLTHAPHHRTMSANRDFPPSQYSRLSYDNQSQPHAESNRMGHSVPSHTVRPNFDHNREANSQSNFRPSSGRVGFENSTRETIVYQNQHAHASIQGLSERGHQYSHGIVSRSEYPPVRQSPIINSDNSRSSQGRLPSSWSHVNQVNQRNEDDHRQRPIEPNRPTYRSEPTPNLFNIKGPSVTS